MYFSSKTANLCGSEKTFVYKNKMLPLRVFLIPCPSYIFSSDIRLSLPQNCERDVIISQILPSTVSLLSIQLSKQKHLDSVKKKSSLWKTKCKKKCCHILITILIYQFSVITMTSLTNKNILNGLAIVSLD